MADAWKKFRYRLEWLGCELLARTMPLLSRAACLAVADFLGACAYRFDARGRTVALANLEVALGPERTAEQREKIARTSYQTFVRTMLSLFWSSRLRPENHREYLALEGVEILQKLQTEGRGAVLLCVHQDNFEWASLACGFHRFPTMIVAEDFKNPLLGPVFNRLRESSGHQIIGQDRSMIRLLKHVRRGGWAGMLIDLNLPPDQASVVIETFGMKTCVTMLHAVLAQRGGAALVPVESRTQPDGTCRFTLHPPLDLPAAATLPQIAQACWDFFEPRVRAQPETWMWAYKHWRYRPEHAARPYPFYANVSSKFEKLWRRQTSGR